MIPLIWIQSLTVLWMVASTFLPWEAIASVGIQKVRIINISPQAIPKWQVISKPEIPVGIPILLRIPAIKLSARIESVWIKLNGAMGTPVLPSNVGWYSPWIRPGETGSAVIAGHLDDQKGRPAAFAHLQKLIIWDTVFVQDNLGAEHAFVVRQVKQYASDENADEVFATSKWQHLNLITCAGSWDVSRKIYTKRLVIFAERVLE